MVGLKIDPTYLIFLDMGKDNKPIFVGSSLQIVSTSHLIIFQTRSVRWCRSEVGDYLLKFLILIIIIFITFKKPLPCEVWVVYIYLL